MWGNQMRPLFPSLIAASAEVRPRATKTRLVCGLIHAVGFLAAPVLMPTTGNAQDTRVAKSMAALKEKTAKLGAPKIEGTEEAYFVGYSQSDLEPPLPPRHRH